MTTPSTPRWLRRAGSPRRLALAACTGLLAAAVAPVLHADPATAAAVTSSSFTQTFSDDFSGTTVNTKQWQIYNNPTSSLAHSAKNVSVHDGMVTLKTQYDATVGKFTTAGLCLCGSAGLYQTYGEYEVHARVSAGDSRALALLWPQVGWPPEVDFMEMGATGDQAARQMNTNTLHYGAANTMIHTSQRADFTQWHTIGVQWGPGFMRYMLDGTPTSTIVSTNVPNQPMRLGLATAPSLGGATTQAVDYDIDWVKQYAWTGGAGAAPSAPSNVVATGGDTSAAVSWTAPVDTGNTLLSSYTVTAQPGGRTITVPRSSNDDPATSTTFTGLTPGVSYSFTVSANTVFGASPASAPSDPATVTGTPPAVTPAPTAAFLRGKTLGSTATGSDVPVRVSWATAAGSSAICAQALTRHGVNGAASPFKVSTKATSLNDSLTADATATYVDQVTGCNGLASPLTAGPTYHYTVQQQDAATASYSGAWSTVACSTCSAGSVAQTKIPGASVTFPVANAYAAALVVRKGPSQSPFKVYVDGTLVGTVYPSATSALDRQIVFTTAWGTAADHTITLVNNGPSAKPVLDVDAVLSLTA